MTTKVRNLTTRCLLLATLLATTVAVADRAQSQTVDAEQPIVPAAIDLERLVDFTRDVYPILSKNCIACHNVSLKEGDFVAENVKSILIGGDSGPAAVPGEPDESLLYLYATRAEEPYMPPLPNQVAAQAVTPQELALLRKWVLEGAKAGSKPQSDPLNWRPVPTNIKSIQSVALSQHSRFVAWGQANQLYVYDLLDGEKTLRLIDPNLSTVEWNGKQMYASGAAHRDLIHSVAVSPDESLIASGGYRVVKLWRRHGNQRKFEALLDAGVTAMAMRADGKLLAAGTSAGQVVLIKMPSGELMTTIAGGTSVISGIDFSGDGQRLFACDHNGSIRCWRADNGETLGVLATESQINSLAYSEDAGLLVTAHTDSQIRIWDVSAAWLQNETSGTTDSSLPKLLHELPGHTKSVTSVAMIPGDPLRIVSGSEDATVRLWNAETGEQLLSIDHADPVNAVAVRPDNQAIAAAGRGKMARAWNLNGEPIGEFQGTLQARKQVLRSQDEKLVAEQRVEHARKALSRVEKEIAALESAAKTTQVAQGKSDAALVDAKQKAEQAAELLAAAEAELSHNDADPGLQKKVADAKTEASRLQAAVDAASSASQTARQAVELVATALQKNQVNLATARSDLSQREQAKSSADESLQQANKDLPEAGQPSLALAFTNNGSKLVTAGTDGLIHLWDVATSEPIAALAGHQQAVRSLLFDQGGQLVSGSLDKHLYCWELTPRWQLVGHLGTPDDNPLDTSQSPLSDRVLAIAFSGDGKLLATGGGEPSRSGELMLWDVETMLRVRQFIDAHSDTVFSVDFSRDKKYLLSGGADKMVKIFDIESGREVRSFEGHTQHVLDVSWKADGQSMVSAGADNVVKYWNIDTGNQIRTIGGFTKQVTSVQFLGVGDRIISCSGDKSVRMHTVTDGKNHRNFAGGTDYMYSATASHDFAIVVAGGEDGVLRLWNGQDGKVLRTIAPTPNDPTPNDPTPNDPTQSNINADGSQTSR